MRKSPMSFERTFFQGLGIVERLESRVESQKSNATTRDTCSRLSTFDSRLFPLRRPALFHQIQQVPERVVVAASLLFSKLAGALVELRGHFGGFFGRTPERGQ